MSQNLPRNTFFSALSAVSNLLLVVLVILAGRILGDSDYGKFSFALAIASMFEMPIDFGLNTLTVKNVARDRSLASRYLQTILPWKSLLSLGVMLLLVPTAYLLAHSSDGRIAVYAMGLAIVLRTFKSTTHAFFRAYERFDLVLLTTYTERILVVVVCGLVLYRGSALIPFAFAFALARTPDLIFSFWLMHRRVVPLGWKWNLSLIRSIQAQAIPFGSLNIITVMYAYIGTVILGALRSPAEVGWYSAGYRIYEGLTIFPFILCSVLLPRLSSLFVSNREKHTELSTRGLKYMLVAGLPIAACGQILAPWILSTIFDPSYAKGVWALRMLFIASALMFANWLLNTILVSADKQSVVLRVTAKGLGISIIAHLVLIPIYGVLGAGIAAVCAELCIFSLYIRLSKEIGLRRSMSMAMWRPAVAGMSAAFLFFLPGMHMRFSIIPAFVLVYTAILLILRTFDADELSALKSIFSPRRKTM